MYVYANLCIYTHTYIYMYIYTCELAKELYKYKCIHIRICMLSWQKRPDNFKKKWAKGT